MFVHISCAAMFLFTPSFDIFSPFLAIYPHVSTAITKSALQNIAWHWQICERYRACPLYVFAYITPMAHTRRAESRAHYHCIYCLRCRISTPFTASIAAARAHICLFAHDQARTFRMHIRQKQAGSHARPPRHDCPICLIHIILPASVLCHLQLQHRHGVEIQPGYMPAHQLIERRAAYHGGVVRT